MTDIGGHINYFTNQNNNETQILTSPNGNKWKLEISNDGTLVTSSI